MLAAGCFRHLRASLADLTLSSSSPSSPSLSPSTAAASKRAPSPGMPRADTRRSSSRETAIEGDEMTRRQPPPPPAPPPQLPTTRSPDESCDALWSFFSEEHVRRAVPLIEVTPSRRLSISSPLRFTRTCSQDSLESLERTCRKELLRRKLLELPQQTHQQNCASSSSSTMSGSAAGTPDASSASPPPPSPPHPPPSPSCHHAPPAPPLLGDLGRSVTSPEDGHPPSSFDLHRPASVCLKRSFGDIRDPPSPTRKTLAEYIGLTPYQQKLMLQSWPNMYSTGASGQFASSIYLRLSQRCPKAKQLLAKANGVAVFANSELDCSAMHARVTLELLDTAIRHFDADHAKLTAYLVEVGRSHRPLRQEGLGPTVWDDLGDCLLDAVRRYDAVRKHKELRRAWLALIAYIIDNMKQGQTIFRSSSSYEMSDGGCSSPGGSTKK